MPITAINTDPAALTLQIIADFTVPVARLWDAYTDPRQIERFWGPPEWPATFTRHDAFVGGLSKFHMTGPDGSSSAGYWQWTAVDPQRSFEVRDGFAGEDGEPKTEMPSMSMVFEFAETALGSRLTTTTSFDSLEQLEELKSMGMVEGTTAAMGQIDAVLEDLATFAHELPTASQLVGDTQVRVSRVVRGSVEQVWQAHTDPDLLRRWQLGPDGWSMPVCEYSAEVGSALRTEWRDDASGEQFGFVGTVLESQPPTRLVTTERMISPADTEGADSPEATNELTLTAVSGGTLVVYIITYPSAEVREMVLQTGMVAGMEDGYSRLESAVL